MSLWHLYITHEHMRVYAKERGLFWSPYVSVSELIIRAPDAKRARSIAYEREGDGKEPWWLLEEVSACVELSGDGAEEVVMMNEPTG